MEDTFLHKLASFVNKIESSGFDEIRHLMNILKYDPDEKKRVEEKLRYLYYKHIDNINDMLVDRHNRIQIEMLERELDFYEKKVVEDFLHDSTIKTSAVDKISELNAKIDQLKTSTR